MRFIALILLILVGISGCSKPTNTIPDYHEIYSKENSENTYIIEKVTENAKEFENNIIIDYVVYGYDKVYENYSNNIEASDIDGSIEIIRANINSLGSYNKRQILKALDITQEELLVVQKQYKSFEYTDEQMRYLVIMMCEPEIYYTYDNLTQTVDQIIYFKDLKDNDNLIVVTWNEEGCVKVESTQNDTLW